MNPATLPISVVVRTYTEKRWDDLVDSLESVLAQSTPPLELLVVVDHNPALLERVRQRFPTVRAVDNQEPRGSGALNAGVLAARGEIVAFLDDDATAQPDWLERLWVHYADPQVLGVGGLLRPVWRGGERPAWFPDEFLWVVGCSYPGLPQVAGPVRNLIGANMSLRRSAFEGAGGFRKGIGHVGGRPVGDEETELAIRVGQHWPEGRLLHEPLAIVDHRVPANRARWSYLYDRCWLEGRSKALVSRLVGSRDALQSERVYTFRTLPLGVWRGIKDAARGDWAGLARAWAIVSALCVTALSYLVGRILYRGAMAPLHEVREIPPRTGEEAACES